MVPDQIQKFIALFSELPSIGPRQATRLAFYLINKGKNFIGSLGGVILDLGKLKTCKNCFFVHQNKVDLCNICSDKNRRQDIIAIIEKETDLLSMEKTGKFNGRYLIIGELKKEGILSDIQRLKLKYLKNQLKNNAGVDEIIVATNPTVYGDLSARAIRLELSDLATNITRLGRGLPAGGELEFADSDTLGAAIENRK